MLRGLFARSLPARTLSRPRAPCTADDALDAEVTQFRAGLLDAWHSSIGPQSATSATSDGALPAQPADTLVEELDTSGHYLAAYRVQLLQDAGHGGGAFQVRVTKTRDSGSYFSFSDAEANDFVMGTHSRVRDTLNMSTTFTSVLDVEAQGAAVAPSSLPHSVASVSMVTRWRLASEHAAPAGSMGAQVPLEQRGSRAPEFDMPQTQSLTISFSREATFTLPVACSWSSDDGSEEGLAQPRLRSLQVHDGTLNSTVSATATSLLRMATLLTQRSHVAARARHLSQSAPFAHVPDMLRHVLSAQTQSAVARGRNMQEEEAQQLSMAATLPWGATIDGSSSLRMLWRPLTLETKQLLARRMLERKMALTEEANAGGPNSPAARVLAALQQHVQTPVPPSPPSFESSLRRAVEEHAEASCRALGDASAECLAAMRTAAQLAAVDTQEMMRVAPAQGSADPRLLNDAAAGELNDDRGASSISARVHASPVRWLWERVSCLQPAYFDASSQVGGDGREADADCIVSLRNVTTQYPVLIRALYMFLLADPCDAVPGGSALPLSVHLPGDERVAWGSECMTAAVNTDGFLAPRMRALFVSLLSAVSPTVSLAGQHAVAHMLRQPEAYAYKDIHTLALSSMFGMDMLTREVVEALLHAASSLQHSTPGTSDAYLALLALGTAGRRVREQFQSCDATCQGAFTDTFAFHPAVASSLQQRIVDVMLDELRSITPSLNARRELQAHGTALALEIWAHIPEHRRVAYRATARAASRNVVDDMFGLYRIVNAVSGNMNATSQLAALESELGELPRTAAAMSSLDARAWDAEAVQRLQTRLVRDLTDRARSTAVHRHVSATLEAVSQARRLKAEGADAQPVEEEYRRRLRSIYDDVGIEQETNLQDDLTLPGAAVRRLAQLLSALGNLGAASHPDLLQLLIRSSTDTHPHIRSAAVSALRHVPVDTRLPTDAHAARVAFPAASQAAPWTRRLTSQWSSALTLQDERAHFHAKLRKLAARRRGSSAMPAGGGAGGRHLSTENIESAGLDTLRSM
ncbi:MAG: hypothetical protein EOO41_00570, partial [Methanobacteriota archaeon]